MRLLALGIVAILSLGGLFVLFAEQSSVGLLTFAQLVREERFVADWNPCRVEVSCKGGIAEYIGNTPDTGTIRCRCPDGSVKVLRDRIVKRLYP